jgi:hypothetical protein
VRARVVFPLSFREAKAQKFQIIGRDKFRYFCLLSILDSPISDHLAVTC